MLHLNQALVITIGRRLTARIAPTTIMGSSLPLHARGAHTSSKVSAMSRAVPLFVPTITMCPKRRPPRPKHPNFTHFHRGGLQFGRIPPQHRAIGGRRKTEGLAAVPVGGGGGAWPGFETRRITLSTPGPTGVEGPEGLASAPVGGGEAWPDNESTRRAKLTARAARGRAAAHGAARPSRQTTAIRARRPRRAARAGTGHGTG